MKKLILSALVVFSFLATARPTSNIVLPLPSCNPCPFVR
jgi:hypothetical protein